VKGNLTKGLLIENPVLRLVLGTCPSLAVTTLAKNSIGMGLAATFVLIGSNFVVSLTRKIIPGKVRIPAFITIIAGFVTIVQMLVKAFAPDIDKALGIFLPLITVNCIILARAESFASKNKVLPSVVDAIGMGIGFTAALLAMSSIREIIGNGTWFGINLTQGIIDPMIIMILPPGGFFVFGLLIAIANKLSKVSSEDKAKISCGACAGCSSQGECGEKA
jgi:electron transport complex protein RnfE